MREIIMKNVMCLLIIMLFIAGCGSPASRREKDLIRQGKSQLDKNNIEDAINSFQEAIDENPKGIKARYMLGEIYLKNKDYERSIEHFKEASELQPDNGNVFLSLAKCYGLLENREEALNYVKKSISIFIDQNDEKSYRKATDLLHMLEHTESEPSKIINHFNLLIGARLFE